MDWVLIAKYGTENEAQIVKGKLEANAITARVTCDNLGGLHAGITPSLSLAKLYVKEDDKEKALKILNI